MLSVDMLINNEFLSKFLLCYVKEVTVSKYFWDKRNWKAFSFLVICYFILMIYADRSMAFQPFSISPTIDYGGIVPLTPGSATTLDVETSGDLKLEFGHILNVNVTVVLCMGEGELTVELTKDDTQKDVVSMFIIGYPANPMFVPNIGITPATISASTVIENSLGGFGIVFIVSGVNSDAQPPHKYELSLKLAVAN